MKTKHILCVIGLFFLLFAIVYYFNPPPDSRIAECRAWSLGEDWEEIDTKDIPAEWNKRHGELFLISDTDPIVVCRAKMFKHWMKRAEATYSDQRDISFKELYNEQ